MSPVCYDREENLQRHGEARQLCHTVGHRACGSFQPQEVGHGVNYPPHTEDQEVDPCHDEIGVQQGVDGPKEEEGENVLHVIAMGPGNVNRTIQAYGAALEFLPSHQSLSCPILLPSPSPYTSQPILLPLPFWTGWILPWQPIRTAREWDGWVAVRWNATDYW